MIKYFTIEDLLKHYLQKKFHILAWTKDVENTYYVSTGKTLQVPRGYYYRVHCDHYAGNVDEYPYDEAYSFTDGIKVD